MSEKNTHPISGFKEFPANSQARASQRIDILDLLRGIAALLVVFFHFGNILEHDWLHKICSYGFLGVHIFFVISGFIIPYSLSRGGYEIRHFPVFVAKRIIRLDPPYLVTIAFIIALGALSWYFPFQQNLKFELSWMQVALHLGYVNTFFGYPWLQDIFWTLAVEFQFYLLLGLTFPLLFHRNAAPRLGMLLLLSTLAFVIHDYIFSFIFIFILGIATCQYWLKIITRTQFAILFVLAVSGTCWMTGMATAIVAALTAGAILLVRVKHPIFTFLSNISYSLYLVHNPIGRRALNVFLSVSHAQSQAAKIVMILLAVGVSIVAAYVLYRLVELPAQRWSASFSYRPRSSWQRETDSESSAPLNPAL